MKKLAFDIAMYLKGANPFEYRDVYETDADAITDILHTLQNAPEVIVDRLAETADDISDSIRTVDEYSEEWKALCSEYEEILNLVNRIRATYTRIAIQPERTHHTLTADRSSVRIKQ